MFEGIRNLYRSLLDSSVKKSIDITSKPLVKDKKGEYDESKVILTIIVVLLFIYLLKGEIGLLYIAFIIGAIGLLSSNIAVFMVKGWMKLAHILSFVFPPILLGLVYLLFLTPVALLSRLWRKEGSLALKNISSTQFKEVNKTFDPTTFEKMW